jgi:hypothetical protein
MGHYNTFILRVWTDGEGGWTRGYIQHVNSQEKAYFTEKSRMDEFIVSHLGPPPGPLGRECEEGDLRDLPYSFNEQEAAGE